MAENGRKCSHPASSMDLYGHPTADRFFAYAQNDKHTLMFFSHKIPLTRFFAYAQNDTERRKAAIFSLRARIGYDTIYS